MKSKNLLDERILKSIVKTTGKIEEVRILEGGRNNKVYKLTNSMGESTVLKIYNSDKGKAGKIRQQKETMFMNFISEMGAQTEYRMLHNSPEYNYSLFNFVEGTVAKRIDEEIIKDAISFISATNKDILDRSKSFNFLENATEGICTVEKFVENCLERLKIETESKYWKDQRIDEWLNKKVIKNAIQFGEKLTKYKDDKIWNEECTGKYASPSDVGVHNTIRTKSGSVFIDFEYAGKDDISKLLADWVCQPEAPMSTKQENELVCGIINELGEYDKFIESRYSLVKPLIVHKWVAIILRRIRINSNILDNKAEIYYERMQYHID